jgi:hypothetical protein
MTSRVFLLTPSPGLGGGIERYAETLEWAFAALGLVCQRVDLQHAGMGAHAGVLANTSPTTILPPGLSEKWFRALVSASEAPSTAAAIR